MTPQPDQKIPLWIKVVILVSMAPLLLYPTLLGADLKGKIDNTLLWLYPAFVIISGICAWLSYRERKEITWILVILMLMCHAALWWIALSNEGQVISN